MLCLHHYKKIYSLLPLLILAACSSSRYDMRDDRPPRHDVNEQKIPNAIPRAEPRSKYGNPESYVINGHRYHVMKTARGYKQRGVASWYGQKFHGHRTSSGETYNMYAMTAAHKTLPLPSYVRVTNTKNKRSIIVKVNDRGPFHDNRIIDLSYVAAKKLGITGTGTGDVEVSYIDPSISRQPRRVSALKNKTSSSQKTGTASGSATNSRIYLQMGAFTERSNAEQLKNRIIELLDSGRINTGYNIENKLYRVRIGPLASAEEATRLADKLTSSGFKQPRIVTD